MIGLSSPCCAAITNHSALFTASNGGKITDQSRTKDLKLESMSMLGESSKTTFLYTLYFTPHHLKVLCLVLSVSNKRALRASDCKILWYFSIDSLAHAAENKCFSCPQTNVKTINTGMEADHYLEMIKPLSGMSTTEQLLCQSARTVYETDCQLVAAKLPVDIAAETNILSQNLA